jgi:diphosphoinositol-polyphosphate diphosphatase
VTTINGVTANYHIFELDVSTLDDIWMEKDERIREWVDYTEALRRLAWKPELAQALAMSSLAPKR